MAMMAIVEATAIPAIAPVGKPSALLSVGLLGLVVAEDVEEEGGMVLDVGTAVLKPALSRKVSRSRELELSRAGASLFVGHDPVTHGLVVSQQPMKGVLRVAHVYHSASASSPPQCCGGMSW